MKLGKYKLPIELSFSDLLYWWEPMLDLSHDLYHASLKGLKK